jgi:hypothetical protein
VGSNPTPRAYLGGSYKNIISFDEQRSSLDKQIGANERILTLNIQQTKKLGINILEEEKLVRKIESITKSLRKQYFKNSLLHLIKRNIENTRIICNYIIAEQTEINIKDSTKESKIKILVWLSNHFQDKKSFKDMTKEDVLEYPNNRRKSFSEDPSQRWIGSYNGRQIILNKFFRWLYSPDEPDHKKKKLLLV